MEKYRCKIFFGYKLLFFPFDHVFIITQGYVIPYSDYVHVKKNCDS